MEKFLLLLLLLIPFPAFAETWTAADGCNTCTGDLQGLHMCTTMMCGSSFFDSYDSSKLESIKGIEIERVPGTFHGREVGFRGDGIVVGRKK